MAERQAAQLAAFPDLILDIMVNLFDLGLFEVVGELKQLGASAARRPAACTGSAEARAMIHRRRYSWVSCRIFCTAIQKD